MIRWYSVLLAMAAFGAGAVGTSPNTDGLPALSSRHAPFVLTGAAFAIPTVDKALGRALRG